MQNVTQNSRGLMGKIHIAKNQLAMHDDSYRSLLKRMTGKDSTTKMTIAEMETVLGEFRRLGFKPKPSARIGQRRQANTPQARLIRALWIRLRDAGQLRDASEDALVAFVAKETGINDMQWLTTGNADKVIKSLRGWIERVGA